MEWGDLTTSIYFKDGSLRDIYVLNTCIDDWQKWIKFVNQNYAVEFYNRKTGDKFLNIDFNKVSEYWDGMNEDGVYASIDLGGFALKCYFTYRNEIENDFSPNEIKNLIDHNSLTKYLKSVSKILNKHIWVTTEMQKNEVLVDVFHDKVTYPPTGPR